MNEDKIEELPEWERELLEESAVRRAQIDARRRHVLGLLDAVEVSWIHGNRRVTITAEHRCSLRSFVDQAADMILGALPEQTT
jgi:hypothetical protein